MSKKKSERGLAAAFFVVGLACAFFGLDVAAIILIGIAVLMWFDV